MRLALSFWQTISRTGGCRCLHLLCHLGTTLPWVCLFRVRTSKYTPKKFSAWDRFRVTKKCRTWPPGVGKLPPRSECPSESPWSSVVGDALPGCACCLSTAIVGTSDLAYSVRRDRDRERAPLASGYGTSPTFLSFHVALISFPWPWRQTMPQARFAGPLPSSWWFMTCSLKFFFLVKHFKQWGRS